MTENWAIVTAADSKYFPLLRGLLASVTDQCIGQVPSICVLDVGLTPEQLQWLREHVRSVVQPQWDTSAANAQAIESVLGAGARAMTSRPHLPKYFPGYDVYLWLDCDTWIQRWDCVEWFLQAMQDHALAIVPQVDRCFADVYRVKQEDDWLLGHCRRCLPEQMARQLAFQLPQINTGVFAMRRDSTAWNIWDALMQEILDRLRTSGWMMHLFEQLAMNVAIYQGQIRPCLLPGLANWPVAESVPRIDAQSRMLTEPIIPFSQIGILHLIQHGPGAEAKLRPVRIEVAGGGLVERSLDYLAVREWLFDRQDNWEGG